MIFSENYLDEYILQGGLTMLGLVPLSIYTLGMVLQRFIEFRASRIMPEALVSKAKSIKSQNEFDALVSELPEQDSALAKILLAYVESGERGESTNPDVNVLPIEDVTDKLYQSLSPISMAYIIGPLLGVLGTTIGIMGTFEQFAVVGKRDMAALVSAIDKSLITTMGLNYRHSRLLFFLNFAK
jgi:biopolymer transport protein ExbB